MSSHFIIQIHVTWQEMSSPKNSKSVLFIAIQIKARNFVWYFTDYFVSVNLHMCKNSYVFASYLTLSIPDIVRSAPSVMDGTRAR